MFRALFDRDTWQEIFGSIQKNKLRTLITVIGVLWGIFIYITLSGASKGIENGFERQFEEVAINSLFVWAQNTSIPYDGFRTGRNMQLKLDDQSYLMQRVPQLQYVAPRIARGVLILYQVFLLQQFFCIYFDPTYEENDKNLLLLHLNFFYYSNLN